MNHAVRPKEPQLLIVRITETRQSKQLRYVTRQKMLQLFYKIVDHGIEWVFRARSLVLQLLKYGALILITTLGADIDFRQLGEMSTTAA